MCPYLALECSVTAPHPQTQGQASGSGLETSSHLLPLTSLHSCEIRMPRAAQMYPAHAHVFSPSLSRSLIANPSFSKMNFLGCPSIQTEEHPPSSTCVSPRALCHCARHQNGDYPSVREGPKEVRQVLLGFWSCSVPTSWCW